MHIARETVKEIVRRLQDASDNYDPPGPREYDRALADVMLELGKVPDVDPGWQTVLDRLEDLQAENDDLRDNSDSWHLLTDALVDDLRMTGPDDDQTVARYRYAVGRALWRAFGIGRRWQAQGTGAKFDPVEVGSPFNLPENHAATDPDPWGLVIDQVVGLAAVYNIDHGGPTTPEAVASLWTQVIYAVAVDNQVKGRVEARGI